jgi:hypothetical protein
MDKENRDSTRLTRYISSLPHGAKYRFMAKVADACEVTLPTINRWREAATTIKGIYREKIEQIAGCKIFGEE